MSGQCLTSTQTRGTRAGGAPPQPSGQAISADSGAVTYLQKRHVLMNYPTYRTAGWPIGSGTAFGTGEFALVRGLARATHLRLRQEHLKRRTHQQQQFAEQQVKLLQVYPPAQPVAPTPKSPRQKTGRTGAQYRWGRQAISLRLLKQANDAKK